MADVFISYARPDRPQAERLARALQVAGFTVWWDLEDLRSGESFNRAVQQALKEARCVVVLWSGTSVKSEYVEAEAYWAWKQKKLHSVRLDDALDLPVPFNTSHSRSLASWDGSPGHADFQRLAGDIASAIGRPQPKQERGPEAEPASTPPPRPATAKQPDQPRPRTLTSVGAAPQPEHGPEPECENAEAPTPPPRRPSPIILALSALAGIAALVAMVVVMSPKGPDPRGTEDARTETPAEQRRDPESVPAGGVEPPEMVTVPAGSFEMGCVSGKGCQDDELPVRTVTFDKPFAIGKYEVTFAEYDRFAEATGKERPSDEGWGRGSRPAINVTWKDAAASADWLSNQTRGRYRLPTEAELEYAARAGSRPPWSFGDREDALGQYAWYVENSDGRTHPAGEKDPNPWGLHDIHGNVWEWVQDCWHKNYKGAPTDGSPWEKADGGDCGKRVVRGGSWNDKPGALRSANRFWFESDDRPKALGFRLAQDL